MTRDIERWMNFDGINFLKRIGIREGMKILDYGCGEGHYTIPLSKVVGNKGVVYAMDKNPELLKYVSKLAKKTGINNIHLIEGDTLVPIDDNSLDFVLAYDMIHYIDKRDRIYKEVKRVLKDGGIFSLYPKHNKDDYPLRELGNVTLEDVIGEVEKSGFELNATINTICLHDNYYNPCTVLNFSIKK